MDGMTDRQFEKDRETLLLLILEMLKNSKDLTELEIKIKALLPRK